MHGDYQDVRRSGRIISFLDLIDVLVVGRLVREGVSFRYLRRAHSHLMAEFKHQHPFCRKGIFTDGREVFIHEASSIDDPRLRELVTRQYQIPAIVMPFLRRVDYDPASQLARRWRIAEGVIVDPGRQFGKPILEGTGIPTRIIATAYEANDRDDSAVADWYGIEARTVRTAVGFERSLLGAAA
jgi:uncharacterized protein (DUF433 family)